MIYRTAIPKNQKSPSPLRGTEIISRSFTCSIDRGAFARNGAFPTTEIQERVPESETVRTFRTSLNLLGDGFVEAIADQTLFDLARDQCKKSKRKICGQVLRVPIVEAAGKTGVGKFGWKDQHASLLSFAGDALSQRDGNHEQAVSHGGHFTVQHRPRAKTMFRARMVSSISISSLASFARQKPPRVTRNKPEPERGARR